MKENKTLKNLPAGNKTNPGEIDLPGYPVYPPDEDIFIRYKEEKDLNPEDISNTKDIIRKAGIIRSVTFTEQDSGSNLDIPGSELDDAMEEIGSEDEENNYYSLGSDDHTDLDENLG